MAVYGSPNSPLKIGDVEMQCYVLDDGRRVIVQSELQSGIGMSRGGLGKKGERSGERRIEYFMARIEDKGIDTNGLSVRCKNPVEFITPYGGKADGFEATILPEICNAVLAAREAGVLHHQQRHIAERCEILVRGLALVGIIALVDEATGFQDARARDALAKILEAFVDQELRKWIKTFPPEFYKQMYRLWGWKFPEDGSSKRTPMAGKLTNDLVYERLAPGVLEELRKVTPRDSKGRLKTHLHRRLTRDVGHPALREHLARVVTMMQLSKTKEEFMDNIDRLCPKFGDTLRLPMEG